MNTIKKDLILENKQTLSIPREVLKGIFREVLDEYQEDLKASFAQEAKEEVLMTRQETADLLGISLPTLNAWRQKGILRPRRMGRKVYYLKRNVLATLKNQSKK